MKRAFYFAAALFLVFFTMMPATVSANSAQPPALVIIVDQAPEDVVISVVTKNGNIKGLKTTVAWETYYVFYPDDLIGSYDKLSVSGGGVQYEVAMAQSEVSYYDRIQTLNFTTRNISTGKLLLRSILLVGLRLVLTIVIEGLVFFLLGFREKRSWMVFLAMNLLTQGWLNISLNGDWPIGTDLILQLVLMEVVIFVAELIGAMVFIKEHRVWRRMGYVLLANLLSLILGGWLIMSLPV